MSGTGKTTLSADPKRHLIGDDEHCWSDEGIFNIEGGCYAKAINLTSENNPDTFKALGFGAVLENVVLEDDRSVDFMDTMMTENMRRAYPIEFIRSAKIPCIAGHPTDIISLTCDAFGILPPVSSLSSVFRRTLSCLASKQVRGAFSGEMQQHQSRVWLVNTGWGGGSYGVGERISLRNTRAIIDAIHTGVLASAPTRRDPVFGLNVVTDCPGVSSDILLPREAWTDKADYDSTAQKLAGLFRENFRKYESDVSAEVRVASA